MFASRSTTLPEMFRRRVAESGESECYRTKRDGVWSSVSWRAFHDEVEALAAALDELGIARGDRIAILGGTQPPWCIADLGAIHIGATTVGIYPTLLVDQISFIMRDAECRVLFVEAEHAEKCNALIDEEESLEQVLVWGSAEPDGPGINTFDAICACL